MVNFRIYRNEETSETSEEFDTLQQALQQEPTKDAQVISNGITFAQGVDGFSWEVYRSGKYGELNVPRV